jgi:hypothetical protein
MHQVIANSHLVAAQHAILPSGPPLWTIIQPFWTTKPSLGAHENSHLVASGL